MFKVTNEEIDNLVNKEYEETLKYGNTYNSDHEFYAVLKEEIEETICYVELSKDCIECLWQDIKSNYDIFDDVDFLEKYLKETIKESLQCLAVIRKYKNKEE